MHGAGTATEPRIPAPYRQSTKSSIGVHFLDFKLKLSSATVAKETFAQLAPGFGLALKHTRNGRLHPSLR